MWKRRSPVLVANEVLPTFPVSSYPPFFLLPPRITRSLCFLDFYTDLKLKEGGEGFHRKSYKISKLMELELRLEPICKKDIGRILKDFMRGKFLKTSILIETEI